MGYSDILRTSDSKSGQVLSADEAVCWHGSMVYRAMQTQYKIE